MTAAVLTQDFIQRSNTLEHFAGGAVKWLRNRLRPLRKLIVAMAFCGALLVSANAYAADKPTDQDAHRYMSNRSTVVQYLERDFQADVRGGHLSILDKDDINFQAATMTNQSFQDARRTLVRYIIKHDTKFSITDEQADELLKAMDDADASARRYKSAGPAWVDGKVVNDFEACVMVPGEPDKYASQKARGLAGYIAIKALKVKPLSYEQHVRFTDLHEMAHCMDHWYVPNMGTGKTEMEKELWRHKAEMIADIGGVLLMAQQGHMDIAQQIAELRAMGVNTASPHNGKQLRTRTGAGNGLRTMAYDTVRGLKIADRTIRHYGAEKVKSWDRATVMDLAHRIVEMAAYTPGEFEIMVSWSIHGEAGIEALVKAKGKSESFQQDLGKARERIAQLGETQKRIVDKQQLWSQSHTKAAVNPDDLAKWVKWVNDRAVEHGGGENGLRRAMVDAANWVRGELAKNAAGMEEEQALLKALPEAVHKDLKAKRSAMTNTRMAPPPHLKPSAGMTIMVNDDAPTKAPKASPAHPGM